MAQLLDALQERLNRLERAVGAAESVAESGLTADLAVRQTLDIFQEVLSIPASGLPPAELFALAVDRVARLLAADRAMLFLAESPGGRLIPRSARGFRREDLDRVTVLPGDGLVGRAYAERRALVYTAAEAGEDPFIDRFPVRDAIAVPVRAEGEVAGVLYAGRRSFGVPFGTSDTLLLLVIADRIGSILIQQGLLERRGGDIARLRLLGQFAGQALVGRECDELLGRACETALGVTRARAALVGVSAASGRLEVRAARGLPEGAAPAPLVAHRGLTGEVYAGAPHAQCRDLQLRRDGEPAVLVAGGFRGALVLPLRLGARTLGVLYLADGEPREFSAEEVEAAQLLASMTAATIENARLYAEMSAAFQRLLEGQERRVESEKARTLGEMAGGIAREFNNIFAIILGKTQLMLARSQDEQLREGLGILEEAAWRGADIVHRLVGLAAAGADEAAGPVDLGAVVQDAVELARPRWKDEGEGRAPGIEVAAELCAVPPVHASPTALREAVMNLIINAVDAMPVGGRLGLTVRSRAGGVELAVSDTGEGIPEEVRPRIFDPFFTTRGSSRLGLGLPVVHGIVTRYQGRIEVASSPGAGTTVTVWLPAMQVPAAPAPPPPLPVPAEPAVPEAASILVLEDEEQIRSTLVDALSHAGHKVEAAAEVADGLAKLEHARFDVVLTDLSLGRGSGLDIARAVKRASPTTPVVLITGWGHLLDPERLRDSGVDLMLVKPFRLERVFSVVSEALRLRMGGL
jgi:signal transduction histidine kinase/CheY-like chemotaxis protein